MAIQIGAKPDSGFDDPLGMLKDCHRRIEQFLHILATVAARAGEGELSGEEKNAVEASLRYFRTGGQRHNQDEEESLFPRLRAENTAGQMDELDRLESDHHRASELHETVDRLYSAWITADRLSSEDQARLLAATREMERLYAEHIQVEERIVFPHAAQVLNSHTLAAIGAEFSARRK
ncbi:hemerythrin domain-containing protein [Acidipila rosea]|uniref:Hemerythrin HHE cation binding domain-containing protein n=1 Tax=Acidipila rosea TaxID=768535 RepID=A0A4R1L6E6_9BACT|nr:hemerythrin domain-containing protein [Acidipila rosea]TCK73746.1 hemerythrin HHE cation binding domain-containing protein [Acidipila rosea]